MADLPGKVTIRALPRFCLYDMQGTADALKNCCGPELFKQPDTPCSSMASGTMKWFWIGRCNWILRAPASKEERLSIDFAPGNLPPDVSIVEISDVYRFHSISGKGHEKVIARLSSIDYRSLSVGSATFTEVLGLKALLVKYTHECHIGIECSYITVFEQLYEETLLGDQVHLVRNSD